MHVVRVSQECFSREIQDLKTAEWRSHEDLKQTSGIAVKSVWCLPTNTENEIFSQLPEIGFANRFVRRYTHVCHAKMHDHPTFTFTPLRVCLHIWYLPLHTCQP